MVSAILAPIYGKEILLFFDANGDLSLPFPSVNLFCMISKRAYLGAKSRLCLASRCHTVKRMVVGIVLFPGLGLGFKRVFTLDWDGLYMVQNHGSEWGSMVLPEASTDGVLGETGSVVLDLG